VGVHAEGYAEGWVACLVAPADLSFISPVATHLVLGGRPQVMTVSAYYNIVVMTARSQSKPGSGD